jgi:hypothetical protein
MDHQATCRFLEVEASGALVLDIDGKRVRAMLGGARIDPSKAARANAFLAERAPRVNLRCTVRDPGPPAVVDIELLAWRDKSGDVWQNLGAVLIEQGLAEPNGR